MSQTTKRALAAVLKQRLEMKSLDHITVAELVEGCGVKRQTFYYHFGNIYDLVQWIYLDEISRAIAENRTHQTWNQGFLELFRYIQENRNFVRNTWRTVNREVLERYLYQGAFQLLMGVVEEQGADLIVPEEEKWFIADFYKFAFSGILLQWIQQGMKEEPQRIVERIDTIISGSIRKALLEYSKICH